MTSDDVCTWAEGTLGLSEASANYVDVLVTPTGLLDPAAAEHRELPEDLIHPLIFLSGARTSEQFAYALREAGSPSVSVVLGTYGLGKTELMHQLSRHLLKSRKEYPWVPCPLFINLALCIGRAGLLGRDAPPSGEEFADLVFGHLVHGPEDRAMVDGLLLPALAAGRVLLILDGVDELVHSRSQYRNFLVGLSRLLRLGLDGEGPAAAPQFRVVITMRREYLSTNDEAEDDLVSFLRQHAPGGKSLSIWFLRLDLFDDSRVNSYLDRRLGADWYPLIRRYGLLLDALHRPLLLRIFCDMVGDKVARGQKDRVVASLSSLINATKLIGSYVEWAARDEQLLQAQQRIEPSYRWDPDRLARTCLRVYLRGKVVMEVPDLRQILTHDATRASGGDADADEVWLSLHKCPFLRRSEDGAHFTHRPFLEYFVAKGVALDMVAADGLDFKAFDTLVLNVDTRKFLKSLVIEGPGEEAWYTRTRHAYGFHDPAGWPDLRERDNPELETERRALLDAMTEPEDSGVIERARDHVLSFLARDHDRLHPRYLIPNLEAVAIFIRSARAGDVSQLRRDFGKQLQGRLEITLERLGGLAPEEVKQRSPLELLVERILSVALRLRFPWVQYYPEAKLEPAFHGDEEVRDRIKVLVKDIQGTLFLAVAR